MITAVYRTTHSRYVNIPIDIADDALRFNVTFPRIIVLHLFDIKSEIEHVPEKLCRPALP